MTNLSAPKIRLALAALVFVIISTACTTFPAQEFKGIKAWINSEPLTLEDLRGKVVLIDFWTYTCVSCLRTVPYLQRWNTKYANDGLVIVGVHSPAFEFEKDYSNVLKATQENGITWPVAQDNDFKTWDKWGNKFWPAKYLIDKDGTVQYSHFGEGRYDKTEIRIRELLIDAGADLSDNPLTPTGDQVEDPAFLDSGRSTTTRELFAGFVMAELGEYVQQSGFFKNTGSVIELERPDKLKAGVIYFDGTWIAWPEHTRHAQNTTGYEDTISLVYSARSVNTVLASDSGEPYQVLIKLDGEYLTEENKGSDVNISAIGESFLTVHQPRMYNIISEPDYSEDNTLTMSSNSDDFSIYSFTFGSYAEGP